MRKFYFFGAMLFGLCFTIQNVNAQTWTSGTNKLYVSPDTTKVGIGTSNPNENLQIYGSLRIGNTSTGSDRNKCRLKFGDGNYVMIGEWQANNLLTFSASKFNFSSGNVGVGTTNPLYKLDVRGTMRAYEVIVDNVTGADFVFGKDYNLRPLNEVNAYIQQNQHLPEIPSAKEMQENGVNMNELQIQLLQKVEELTLYIIQQEKEIQELKNQIQQSK